MKWKVYHYAGCDTCRRALKFLKANGVEAELIPIREQPPTEAELRRMLKQYDGKIRRLFNTSGQVYKRLGLSVTLPSMSETEALDLLASNGHLVKRPFVLTPKRGILGFDEVAWTALVKAK